MDRNTKLLSGAGLGGKVGLEIGPLTAPVVKKSPETKVYYLDHMSQEELKKKYKNEPVELDEIVPVDYVVEPGMSLAQVVKGKRFDYVVASHVIEHVPDMIRWLQQIYDVLTPGGTVYLAIPDKRATFDINRQCSLYSDVVGAYLDKLSRPSSAMMYDFATKCLASVSSEAAWAGQDYSNAKRYWTNEEVFKMCKDNLKPGVYVDCHCYVFSPASFSGILHRLIEDGYLNFEVSCFRETDEGELEFYVALKRPVKPRSAALLAKSVPHITEKNFRLTDDEQQLKNKVLNTEQQLHEVLTSSSWKITGPCRAIGKRVRRR